MTLSTRILTMAAAAVMLLTIAACGADEQATEAQPDTVVEPSGDDVGGEGSGENGDDDHGDDDGDAEHGDEDDGDEDHGDDDHSDGGLGAHEHGAAELTVAWSGSDMVIDLVSPTHNIFGFEYEPTTDGDLAVVADRTDALTAPGVLAINPEAGCTLTEDATTELEYEGSHAELTATWLLVCEDPAEIRQIDAAGLFAEFPNLNDVDAQWASESGQSSAELSPSDAVLVLE